MTRTEPKDSPGGMNGRGIKNHGQEARPSGCALALVKGVSAGAAVGAGCPSGAEVHQCPASRLRALHPEGPTWGRGHCWAAHRALQVQAVALVTWQTACKGPGEGAQARSQRTSLVCAGGLRPVIPAQLLQDMA